MLTRRATSATLFDGPRNRAFGPDRIAPPVEAARILRPCSDDEDRRDLRHVTPSHARLQPFGLRQSRFFQSTNTQTWHFRNAYVNVGSSSYHWEDLRHDRTERRSRHYLNS